MEEQGRWTNAGSLTPGHGRQQVLENEAKKRKTRRELFLKRMEGLIHWQRLEERIPSFCPKARKGRRPYPLAVVLRIHCMQLVYSLSDPGMEDPAFARAGSALRGQSVRRFVGLKLSGALPAETTILNFRHLLEKHILGQGLFEEINAHLESQGLWLREGTIVGATIIEAPSSTKNRARERDPEMRQTRKGNKWHFGMKVHIGVDSDTGLTHSMSATAANVHDITEAHNLLHGGETMVWCDAGYQAVHQREENWELKVDWQVAIRPGKRRKLEPGSDEAVAEKEKASVRAKVEHPFLKVKRIFDCGKVRYRGLAKNTQRLALLLGLCNLMTAEGPLAGLRGGRAGPDQASRPFQAPAVPAEAKSAATDTHQQGQKAGHILESWPTKPKTGRTWSCSEDS